jgi:Protein of unknown function (DUF4127)
LSAEYSADGTIRACRESDRDENALFPPGRAVPYAQKEGFIVSLRHRQHRVAVLPLDDRPVSTRALRLLARMVDYDIQLPPAEVVGRFDQPGDPEAAANWLAGMSGEVDSIVVSLDMLVYGGYVASRQSHVRTEAALQRLEFLGELRRQAPTVPIRALATIPPPEGIPLAGHDVSESRAVARHAELVAQAEAAAEVDGASADEIADLRAVISPEFLSRYHEMRRRNLTVNLRAVELTDDGILDFVTIGQESPAAVGPHVRERDELQALIADRGVSRSAVCVDGYSHGAAALLVRFVHDHMGTSPAIATIYSEPPSRLPSDSASGLSVEESVRAQIVALGASEVEDPADADICLYVSVPAALSFEEATLAQSAYDERRQALRSFAIDLSGWVAADRLAALADAAFPGTADDVLMRTLHDVKVDLTRLGAFSARETLGASVGMALAHVCLRRIALRDKGAFDLAQAVGDLRPMRYLELLDSLIDSERSHIRLLFSRFAEDYLYQARLKHRAAAYVADLVANSPISLTAIAGSAEEFVRTTLSRAAGEFYIEHFLGRQAVAIGSEVHRSGLMLCELQEARVQLPWGRLAEVGVDLDFDLQLVAEPPE